MTLYRDIFSKFLSQIGKEPLYSILTPEQSEQDMMDLMILSFSLFKTCEVDFDDRDDVSMQFNNIINENLQTTIANGMIVHWCKRYINNIDVVKQRIMQSDFKMTSQANHLEKLINMKEQAMRDFEITQKRLSYSTNYKSKWGSLGSNR